MSQDFKPTRIQQVASTYNVSISTLTDFLKEKGHTVENNPNAKISPEQHKLIADKFEASKKEKNEALKNQTEKRNQRTNSDDRRNHQPRTHVNKSNDAKPAAENKTEPETIRGGLQGTKVVGKVDLEPNKDGNRNDRPNNYDRSNNQNRNNSQSGQNKSNFNNRNADGQNRNSDGQNRNNFSKNQQNDRRNNNEPRKEGEKRFDTPRENKFEPKPEPKLTTPELDNDIQTGDEDTDAIQGKADKLKGLTVLGKIDLPVKGRPKSGNNRNGNSQNAGNRNRNNEDRRNQDKDRNAAPRGENTNADGTANAEDPEKKRKRKRKKTKKPIASASESGVSTIGQVGRITGGKLESTGNTGDRPRNNTNGGGNYQNSGNQNNRDNNQNRNRNNSGTQQNSNYQGNNPRNQNSTGGPRNQNNTTGGQRNQNSTTGGQRNQNSTTGPRPQNTTAGGTGNTSNTNTSTNSSSPNNNNRKKGTKKPEYTDEEIGKNVKKTLNSQGKTTNSRVKFRKEKRAAHARAQQEELDKQASEAKILRVTEFVSANEFASLMNISIGDLISKCIQLGQFISINQRLDADMIVMVADEFGFEVEFISTEDETQIAVAEEIDDPALLIERAPIVTIMGHVDHGKTTLLDKIRKANVALGEAGGITQHIGAYSVRTSSGKSITFLDTPGHEAFTAMRARGAKVTDIVIIVVAADDGVMPQTKEAINHALVAGVPIVIAINKVDKAGADPEKIKKELAEINILVEDWSGKYQCQEIAAKQGKGIDELLEKVLLEAEILELKANPERKSAGTVIEASLDKGRGYVATLLVQNGSLKVGDVVLAGAHYGKVRAMQDHFGTRVKSVGPSAPVQVLGLDGAPQAGDKFTVLTSEREAREIASKRQQILREQTIRATKRLTLTDIGRRKALGNFHQLNLIIKGDVDGSVEALSDALLKLSTEEVEVNILHKAVGPVSESDVLLASASDAVIIGFQVRPSKNAKAVAERESIEIRTYSVIYQAIDEVKLAIEGLLAPGFEEHTLGHAEIREIYKIPKVGTSAGCYITDGVMQRHCKMRLLRQGVIVYEGKVSTLRRFKDDVTEVKQNYECGIMLDNFNDFMIGDEIEAYEMKEVKRKLK